MNGATDNYLFDIYLDHPNHPRISIHAKMSDSDYCDHINKLLYYIYTEKSNWTIEHLDNRVNESEPKSQFASQIEYHKKIFWNYMYDGCFGISGLLYLLICNKYLIPDVKKLIINNILTIEK